MFFSSNFFRELFKIYSQINFDETIKHLISIDSNYVYYLADSQKQLISNTNNLTVDIDVESAFPSIIKATFGKNHKIVKIIESKKTKKAKNIFIATNFKPYIKQLNIICKILIVGVVAENIPNIFVFELKKDGILLSITDELIKNFEYDLLTTSKPFINLVVNKFKFNFNITKYKFYLRNNRTSFLFKDNKLSIKGTYKYLPDNLYNILNNYINGEKIDFREIQQIYSEDYLNIILYNGLSLLNGYYKCSNDMYLDINGKYNKNIKKISTVSYLKIFVFPIIASFTI